MTLDKPRFNALTAAARKKLNAPEAWEWFKAEVLTPTDDTLVEGGVPLAGVENPRRRWKGVESQRCVVTRVEMRDAEVEYERTTGNCHECSGSGDYNYGWSRDAGVMKRPCHRCQATGRAPVATAA